MYNESLPIVKSSSPVKKRLGLSECKGNTSYQVANAISMFSDSKESPFCIKPVRVNKSPNEHRSSIKGNLNTSFNVSRRNLQVASRKLILDSGAQGMNKSMIEQSRKFCIRQLETCTLTNEQITQLYQAKCEDLKVGRIPKQETRFREHCHKFCINGKITLKEVSSFVTNRMD